MKKSGFRWTIKNTVVTFMVAFLIAFGSFTWFQVLTGTVPILVVQERLGGALPASAAEKPKRIGVPLRIRIPSIGVDSVVEKVGLAKNGSMAVPLKPMNAGWYELGPRPGEIGSAVVAGHVNWWYGQTGIFRNLARVKVGDTIVVQDESGVDVSFVVRKVKTYAANADASEVFLSADGGAHLNLVTCVGAWNRITRQYSQRLVVFADRVTK